MPDNTNPALVAGPERDGAKSLAKESKVGALTQWAITILGTGALGWLANLDTSHWSGWWASTAVAGVGGLGGLIAAYLKRNR